ncbi:MAG: hypothetical protein LBR35_00545 [Rickettsiales bacterium]|jgi:hypothetical protein|nr:hypothetical protein [Rickettsiales bacterium]
MELRTVDANFPVSEKKKSISKQRVAPVLIRPVEGTSMRDIRYFPNETTLDFISSVKEDPSKILNLKVGKEPATQKFVLSASLSDQIWHENFMKGTKRQPARINYKDLNEIINLKNEALETYSNAKFSIRSKEPATLMDLYALYASNNSEIKNSKENFEFLHELLNELEYASFYMNYRDSFEGKNPKEFPKSYKELKDVLQKDFLLTSRYHDMTLNALIDKQIKNNPALLKNLKTLEELVEKREEDLEKLEIIKETKEEKKAKKAEKKQRPHASQLELDLKDSSSQFKKFIEKTENEDTIYMVKLPDGEEIYNLSKEEARELAEKHHVDYWPISPTLECKGDMEIE